MKHVDRTIRSLFILPIFFSLSACENKMKSDIEKQSYAAGVQMAQGFKKSKIALDSSLVQQAVNDVMNDRKLQLKPEELQSALLALSERAEAARRGTAEANLPIAKKFIEDFAKNKGVKRTSGGVFYRVIKPGQGATPTDSDTVKIHYTGKLADGLIFDSSVLRNQPGQVLVNSVIPGWREALKLMNVGAKWEVMIPPELAYGTSGNTLIPPNSALLFELELLSIKGK